MPALTSDYLTFPVGPFCIALAWTAQTTLLPRFTLLACVYLLLQKHVYYAIVYQWPHVFVPLYQISAVISQYFPIVEFLETQVPYVIARDPLRYE